MPNRIKKTGATCDAGCYALHYTQRASALFAHCCLETPSTPQTCRYCDCLGPIFRFMSRDERMKNLCVEHRVVIGLSAVYNIFKRPASCDKSYDNISLAADRKNPFQDAWSLYSETVIDDWCATFVPKAHGKLTVNRHTLILYCTLLNFEPDGFHWLGSVSFVVVCYHCTIIAKVKRNLVRRTNTITSTQALSNETMRRKKINGNNLLRWIHRTFYSCSQLVKNYRER